MPLTPFSIYPNDDEFLFEESPGNYFLASSLEPESFLTNSPDSGQANSFPIEELELVLEVENHLDETESTENSLLIQLSQAGFTQEQLEKVLSHKKGSEHLMGLGTLLQFQMDASGQFLCDQEGRFITSFKLLQEAGFTIADMISVLNYDGGEVNLAVLSGLVQEQVLLDGKGTFTLFKLYQEEGFTVASLVSVLSHRSGHVSLTALRNLFQYQLDKEGAFITPYKLLKQAGFTVSHIVSALNYHGGSPNLKALENLLTGVDCSALHWLNTDDIPVTQITLFTKSGFSIEQVVSILSHCGGSKNLNALVKLVLNPTVSFFLFNNPSEAASIYFLANKNSSSAGLLFLNKMLEARDYNDYILQPLHFKKLCVAIRVLSAKALASISIHSLDDLKLFCEGKKRDFDKNTITPEAEQEVVEISIKTEAADCLLLLKKAGFTESQLDPFLHHASGLRYLTALGDLLHVQTDAAREELQDEEGSAITPLHCLKAAGFTLANVISVINHRGGIKSLEALKNLVKMQIDEKGTSLTHFQGLQHAGFTVAQVISVLSHDGGAISLAALENLLNVLVDEKGIPFTGLQQLESAGFKVIQIVSVLRNNGGSRNLAALQGLLQLVDENDISITRLERLKKAGFSVTDLISILSYNGGSINLAALENLLRYQYDATGKFLQDETGRYITWLEHLNKMGFTHADLVRVLSNIGGSKNLAVLQSLLQAAVNANLNEDGSAITSFQQFTEAGFSIEQLVCVLSYGGGSKGIGMLQDLLLYLYTADGQLIVDKEGWPLTPLKLFNQVGFTIADIVSALSHTGGTKSLLYLESLLQQQVDVSAPILRDNNGCPITQLGLLVNAGITPTHVISILKHPGGSNNLSGLIELLSTGTVLDFLLNYSFGVEHVFNLANYNATGKHLHFLNTILKVQEYRDYIKQHKCLGVLCGNISLLPAKKILNMSISSIDELKPYCGNTDSLSFQLVNDAPSAKKRRLAGYGFFEHTNLTQENINERSSTIVAADNVVVISP